jgi:YHS domain-containing protein
MSTSTTILASEHKISTTKLTRFVTLCGRVVHANPANFPRAEYRGKTIYLCTEACLGAFRADPDVLYKAHRNLENKKGA